MKKISTSLLIALPLLFTSCTTKQGQSEELSDSRILSLLSHIPGICENQLFVKEGDENKVFTPQEPDSKKYFATEFLSTWEEAKEGTDLHNDIAYECTVDLDVADICYGYEIDDSCSGKHEIEIISKEIEGDSAFVEFNLYHEPNPNYFSNSLSFVQVGKLRHTAQLVFEDNQWCIANYDKMLEEMEEKINAVRTYFDSEECNRSLIFRDDSTEIFGKEEPDSQETVQEKELRSRIKQYWSKYAPNTYHALGESEEEENILNHIADLAKSLPDHGMENAPSWAFDQQFYSLLQNAYDIPNAYLDLGDEEFLYYFVSGNDDCICENHPITTLGIKWADKKDAQVRVNYRHRTHTLDLTEEDNNWVIQDFDDERERVTLYVDTMRTFLKNRDWDAFTNEEINAGLSFSESETRDLIKKMQSEVETYFEKHP